MDGRKQALEGEWGREYTKSRNESRGREESKGREENNGKEESTGKKYILVAHLFIPPCWLLYLKCL